MKVLISLAILTQFLYLVIAPLFLLNLFESPQEKQPSDKEDDPETHFMRG